MPTFKTVWQFVESNGATFTEVWYKDGSSITSIVSPADPSVQLRLPLLHPFNTLVRIRVSQVGVLRNTLPVLVNAKGTNLGLLGPLGVGAAMVCTVSGVGGGSRKIWIRGCARDDYGRNIITGVDAPSNAFITGVSAWFAALQNASYGILRLTPLTNPATQISPLTIADGTITPGRATMTMSAPIALVPGQVVIISRCNAKDLPRLNGRFTVIASTATTFTIPYSTPAGAKVTMTQGQVKALAFDPTHVINATASGFDHIGTRTSKSPLSGSRGAKRAARIRQLP